MSRGSIQEKKKGRQRSGRLEEKNMELATSNVLELANISGTLVSHIGYAHMSLGKPEYNPTTCDI